MSNVKRCFDSLNENEGEIYTEVCDVLSRLCRNVIRYPNEIKYRKVRLSNPIVTEKILPAVGAMECLFAIGFVEKDDHLLLPENASLYNLRELQSLLSEARVERPKPQIPQASPAPRPSTSALRSTASTVATSNPSPKDNTTSESEEAKFFDKIRLQFENVLNYENAELQKRAKGIVPLDQLQINAMEKMRMIQRDSKSNGGGESAENVTMEDLVFVEVLKWFKEKFFQWVDNPECTNCRGKCSFVKEITTNRPGLRRVEIHRCTTCATTVEFPRYIDPGMLLYTRKGRCGEWAMAFALICRSLGYDTRFVWDYTDHVWVEIWSFSEKRWIHADPCENVMDRPLMYEKGWGKKLSYIFAFSKDEMQDVTWRYTSDQKAVMERRNLCTEESLLSLAMLLTETRRRSRCSAARQQYLIQRSLMELVELITCQFEDGKKKVNEKDDYQGRTSGSLAWRLARHETKIDSQSSYTWQIPSNVESVKLRYTTSSDEYVFLDSEDKILEKKEGWMKGVYEMDGGIFRKVESDWKMVYLARSPGNEVGKIQWNIEITDSNFNINQLSFRSTTAVFNNAIIEWKIVGYYKNGETKVIPVNDSGDFKTDQLNGAFKISLSALLSGGKNDSAWQHAQLFRQSLDAGEHSMEINIHLNKRIS